MEVRLLAVGTRVPQWVGDGYRQYASRLTRELKLTLSEIPVTPRRHGDVLTWKRAEGDRMLEQIKPADWVVALDVEGKAPSTAGLAGWLETWLREGRRVVVTIGGPDGLDERVLERADQRWSLSALTLPHGLVRVVLAEALYRATTVRDGHPYHRA
ncbi:MAG: 23S rRNA (pseudouridine(1915)-N(3))-methyltransferase RlmH [Gammaproteobacteria bacterium]